MSLLDQASADQQRCIAILGQRLAATAQTIVMGEGYPPDAAVIALALAFAQVGHEIGLSQADLNILLAQVPPSASAKSNRPGAGL